MGMLPNFCIFPCRRRLLNVPQNIVWLPNQPNYYTLRRANVTKHNQYYYGKSVRRIRNHRRAHKL